MGTAAIYLASRFVKFLIPAEESGNSTLSAVTRVNHLNEHQRREPEGEFGNTNSHLHVFTTNFRVFPENIIY